MNYDHLAIADNLLSATQNKEVTLAPALEAITQAGLPQLCIRGVCTGKQQLADSAGNTIQMCILNTGIYQCGFSMCRTI